MKVWLGEDEVEQFPDVTDTTRRIAFGLSLRSGEIVQVTSTDVTDGPAGTMVQIHEEIAKGDKYRETPFPSDYYPDRRRRPREYERRAARQREHADPPPVGGRPGRGDCRRDGEEGWHDLTAHDFRRTWATALVTTDGISPLLVCQWGGWSDLETFLDHYHGAHSPEAQRRARDAVDWL